MNRAEYTRDWTEATRGAAWDRYAIYIDEPRVAGIVNPGVAPQPRLLAIVTNGQAFRGPHEALESYLQNRELRNGERFLVLWLGGGGITRFRVETSPRLVEA